MPPRIIQLPLSGRDRQHYVRELREAERAHAAICEQVKVAITVVPLALFFRTDADREEFVAAVMEAKPGMVAKRRPR